MPIDLKKFEARLLEERARLFSQSEAAADARKAPQLDQQSVGRLSRQDALQQQAMANAQEQLRRRDLGRIERALGRIEAGAYGECLECGEEIAEARLEIDPMAELCRDCRR